MRNFLCSGLIALLVIVAVNASAEEEIYQWTDANGVRHFSSVPPSDASLDVETYKSADTSDSEQPDEDSRRQSYDQMIEKQRSESLRREQERQQEQKAGHKKKMEQERQEREAKIDAEKKKLQQQIEALKKRGLSPTFPKGMRDSQIEDILKKINALEKELK